MINGVTGTAPAGDAVVTGQEVAYAFVDASTVLDGETESITGGFGYDSLTGIEYGAFISLRGSAPFSGVYAYDVENIGRGFGIEAEGGPFLDIGFANKLSFSDDPLSSVEVSSARDNAPTGFVCPSFFPFTACLASPVPEPSTLAILAGALGLLLLGPGAVRRAGQPRADRRTRA